MLANLTAGLDFHSKALVLRAQRQGVIASNIANADTPDFAARDINFKESMSAANSSSLALDGLRGSSTNPAHIATTGSSLGGTDSDRGLVYAAQSQPSMDGNSVDLDRERANFADNSVRYEATLRFINGYSKTILSAIQGQ
jgi:flagellar basal-body rod protein FlgB